MGERTNRNRQHRLSDLGDYVSYCGPLVVTAANKLSVKKRGQGRCHHWDYLVFLRNCARIPFQDLCLTGNACRVSIWWSFSTDFISWAPDIRHRGRSWKREPVGYHDDCHLYSTSMVKNIIMNSLPRCNNHFFPRIIFHFSAFESKYLWRFIFLTILHDSVRLLVLCYLRVFEIWRRNGHPCSFATRTISSADAPALYRQ